MKNEWKSRMNGIVSQPETASAICFVGSARYHRELGVSVAKKFKALAELGTLFVIGFSEDRHPRRFTRYAHFYLFPNFSKAIFRYAEMFGAVPFLLLWLIFRQRVSTLVAQSPYDGVSAAFAKKIAGLFGRQVVLVIESHGDFEKSFFLYHRVGSPHLFQRLMRAAAGFSLKQADGLRTISQATSAQLRQMAPEKPLVQFMAWTDIEVFLEAGRVRRQDAPSATFLYVGVLSPVKGLKHLIEAFGQIASERPDARLVLIGRTQDSEYAADLRQRIDRLHIGDRVEFVQELPQAQVAQWMAKASVFVLPSLSEGLGRVVVEAMAAGLPVLGSRVGGIPELVREGETGFLAPPGDERALSETLLWCLQHPKALNSMRAEARAFAQCFFSAEQYIEGYASIIMQATEFLQHQALNGSSLAE
jgi:glycosyltransferase involved in cell wall biosynthesis